MMHEMEKQLNLLPRVVVLQRPSSLSNKLDLRRTPLGKIVTMLVAITYFSSMLEVLYWKSLGEGTIS